MKHTPLTEQELSSLEGKRLTPLQQKRFEASTIILRGSDGPIRAWFADLWYHLGPAIVFLAVALSGAALGVVIAHYIARR